MNIQQTAGSGNLKFVKKFLTLKNIDVNAKQGEAFKLACFRGHIDV